MTGLDLASAAGRALHLSALAVAAGAAVAPFLARGGALDEVARRWRRAAAVGLLLALVLLLAAQALAFRDPFEPFFPQLRGLLLRTDWGRTWGVQAALAVALAGVAAGADLRKGRLAWATLATASAASLGFTGHSWAVGEGRGWVVAADAAHAVAGSLWVGTLAVLVAAARRGGGIADGGLSFDLPGAVARFSRTALVAVPLLVVTGGVATWVHGGGLGALAAPGWGRALVVKLALFSGMAALGFYNWRVTLPALRGDDEGPRFGRGAPAWEALLGAAVLVATAVLVGLSPPRGG